MRHRLASLLLLLLLSVVPLRLPAQGASLDSVDAAIRAGASWHATTLLRPLLGTAESRTPEALLLAARAAAGWQGWSTVERLLADAPWLDTRFDRTGRRLLAEAALAAGRGEDAIAHARRALAGGTDGLNDDDAARRWVVLARAHERLGAWDSASTAYVRAAAHAPRISDWLALRAAGASRDSIQRARLYRAITTPAARARVDWTEALARNRFLEREAAARLYARLGATATALRLRWEATPSGTVRARVAREALELIRAGTPTAEVRQAIDLVVGYSIPMARSESLMVARRAVDVGRPADADRYLRALARGGRLDEGAMLAWGDAESALGKWDAAARSYRTIRTGALAGRAAYLAARADLRGGQGDPVAALSAIPGRFPDDAYAAGNALYLLGDLALDANRPDSARSLFHRLVEYYPKSEFAERAALIAPLIAHAKGQHQLAARELEAAIDSGVLAGFAADAGRYWGARALEAAGDRELATARYRTLLERGPENYYAQRAAARLGVTPWRFGASRVDTAGTPVALQRVRLLEELGLDTEARFELDAFGSEATTPTELLEAAAALLAAEHPARGSRLALRAIAAGAPRDGLTLRLLYPLPHAASLRASAAAAGLDPWLAAAVIRQESGFEPRAVSGAGARGLMQVMPANGAPLARAIGLADWDVALLFEPDVNLAMGTRHLAEALRRYPDLERALAAYNAGGSRVARWNRTLLDGTTTDQPFDVELYVERIPYLETRGYVRNIVVNREMYRLLYESL